MEAVFLGTSSMVPTKERNHSAIFVSTERLGLLFDCGEGTQRQFRIAGIPMTKVNCIFISHWHGDHVFGLPGLIQTLDSTVTEHSLKVFGPQGSSRSLEHMKSAFLMEGGSGSLKLDVRDVNGGKIMETDSFFVEALPLEHTAPCLGYSVVEKQKRHIDLKAIKKFGVPEGPLLGRLQRGVDVVWRGQKVRADDVTYLTKGKKLTILMDTRMCRSAVELARDADVLICESTYANELEEKASQYRHLTAQQAAMIANRAGVGRLVLTHFSQRYKNTQVLEEDAREFFDSVVCAKEFMRVTI